MTITKDSYNTFKNKSEGLFKDRGSKFLSFGYPISDEQTAKELIIETRKKYHDARHHCFAYKIGSSDDNYRVNDDGEPSGTAGKPIYGQFLANNLSDVLIIVVRYFGGTLLGTSGLINAYRSSTADCIANANLIERVLKMPLNLIFKYELLSIIMRLVKEEDLEIAQQDFTIDCKLNLLVRQSDFERINARFRELYGVEIT